MTVEPGRGVELLGRTLDQRYLVQELIGSGANSSVYRAEDLSRKYHVAVKVMSGSLADEKSRERCRHGAETAGSLAHPNIVRLYSFNVTSDDLPYFVLDCVQGENLGDVLRRQGALSEALCISTFIQVCDALEHAHAKGVVHRNLKPSNIMVIAAPGDTFMVKIADFGLAKARGEKETRQSLAKKGELLGNPLYMSPEQCTGGKIDERADIYAAACLLFECLTGKPPYAGINSFEIMSKHMSETPPDLKQVAPQVKYANQLNTILGRALAKDAGHRYQSAGEMSHDLNLILEAPEAEWMERAVAMRPVVVSKPRSSEDSALTFDVFKPLLIGCSILLLLVVLAGTGLVAIAITDADFKPLMRYKIAVQEVILAPNDERLIRNLNYMTDYYKSRGDYADAWKYKEKVLKAVQPASNPQ
jgi:serine/threonine protein kinase